VHGILNAHILLAKVVQFRQNWTCQHFLYLNLTSAFWVKEKKEFPNGGDDIERIKRLSKVHKLRESRHQFENVVLQVFLFEIAKAA